MIIAKKKSSYANSIYKANFLLGSIIDIDSMKSEKMDTTQNTLEKSDLSLIWIPKLVYMNNKNNFHTLSKISDDNSDRC